MAINFSAWLPPFAFSKFIFGMPLDRLHRRQNLKCIRTHQRDKSQHIGFKIVFGGEEQKKGKRGRKYLAFTVRK